jgi:hypothetical protein
MTEVKYRNESKAVLVEIDMVHGDINELMIFSTRYKAKVFCYLTYKIPLPAWSGNESVVSCYIDETRRLEIWTVREVSEF